MKKKQPKNVGFSIQKKFFVTVVVILRTAYCLLHPSLLCVCSPALLRYHRKSRNKTTKKGLKNGKPKTVYCRNKYLVAPMISFYGLTLRIFLLQLQKLIPRPKHCCCEKKNIFSRGALASLPSLPY